MAVLEDQEEERLELEDWSRSEKSDMILFDRRVLLSSDDWRPFRSLMTSFFSLLQFTSWYQRRRRRHASGGGRGDEEKASDESEAEKDLI